MKMKKALIIALAVITVAAAGTIGFDAYKFFRLETFSQENIESVCINMSGIDGGSCEQYTFPENENTLLCIITDDSNAKSNAMFAVERVYYHGLKAFGRYKVSYGDTGSDSIVSSLEYPISDDESALVYYWNRNIKITKADYEITDMETGEKTTDSLTDITLNYTYIKYNSKNSVSLNAAMYDDENNVIYSEEKSIGKASYITQG